MHILVRSCTGGDQNTPERDTSHNMWMQQLVSVYEVTSLENNDTKISNFGSIVCFLGHICEAMQCQGPKFPLFSLNKG